MIASPAPTVAVVGAGPGGLASAMLLAASGVRVRVYESQPVVGGRSARISKDGYHFDTGPTFFLMPYVLDEIFSACGKRVSDYVHLHRLDPMYRLVIGNPEGGDPWTIEATQDIEEMARRIGAIHPGDGEAFPKYISDNRAKLRAAEPILRAPIRSVFDLMNAGTIKALPHIRPHMSVHQLLSRYFEHHASQLAVSFQSKYLGMSPYDCPSLFTILPFIEYEYGIWHPIGGCNAIMTAMADALREMGGEIVTDASVEEITFEGKKANGVVVNGERHAHDHVVVNADASWAIKNLIPESLRPTHTDSRLDAKRYSCSTYMMYLGVDGEIDLPHHTIFISEKYTKNLDDISVAGELSEDASTYVCNPSPIDPSLAPEGKSSLYVHVPTSNTNVGEGKLDWDEHGPKLRETTLDQLERRFGIADIRDRIESETVYTPETWKSMGINFGATFNMAHNLGQMLHKRPHHRLQDV
ncbi:MAG: phytoene desaturase family protein, partial [Planctomycetota bacterium]